ncbi:MAG: malectin domain-containing carbohydrate-binding protein [Planctomycetota bacterium]
MRLPVLVLASLSSLPLAQSSRVAFGAADSGIDADVTTAGSFVVRNTSASERIAEVHIQLASALWPDLAFDPNGTAGDLVAKPFTIDAGGTLTGFVAESFEAPLGGGFGALRLTFNDFEPGETFAFSVDVDPTTIQGAPAPGPSGSGHVSGLELSGAEVRVTYEGGPVHMASAFHVADSFGEAVAEVRPAPAPAPGIELVGKTAPAQVFTKDWKVRVTGTPGAAVTLLEVEGGLFTAGVPGGGYDVDPFEANSALDVVQHQATFDGWGVAEIAVELEQSVPQGGIHAFLAVESGAGGIPGRASEVLTVAFVDVPLSFTKKWLQGTTLLLPTSLQFGPDDRLYVSMQEGIIRAFTITITGGGDYKVTDTETIELINQIPNHDDDGVLNPAIDHRQITGILVAGTAERPVIYVTSSDPRIGGKGAPGSATGVDTNSGVISKLERNGSTWSRRDLVRGLPRSAENHGPNGMQLDPKSNTLYVGVGGNTNMGAPSSGFLLTPEYALSAAILAIDLGAIGNLPYNLPTLDDEDRPGAFDAGDPFGGNGGKNQAILDPLGPVQIHSPGWRNPYDLVLTEAGRMYAVDNGPNGGWGAPPAYAGGNCTNGVSEPGETAPDGLHWISAPGYYAGHPNPTRANKLNTFNPTNPQSPVAFSNPVECEYRLPGVDDGSITTWTTSTNGIVEYRASSFGGAMRGDLLTVSLNQSVRRVKLNEAGDDALVVEDLFSSVGSGSLDITAQGDEQIFPGTVWVANRNANSIAVFIPDGTLPCTGLYDAGLDDDLDGYSNADEVDNDTDPCSAADVPADFDGDLLSDLNDPDDDNDGIQDHQDAFALDAANGLNSAAPFLLSWETNTGGEGGLLDLGFTGLMANGETDYQTQFDPTELTAGGAAGVLTVEKASAGTAIGAPNNQDNAFQAGFALPFGQGSFTARTVVNTPFLGFTPAPDQAIGFFLGTGDQDNFLALTVTAAGVEYYKEVSGLAGAKIVAPLAVPGPATVELLLDVDPATQKVTPLYAIDGAAPVAVASPQSLPAGWAESQALAIGLLTTAAGGASFPATWDEIGVVAVPAPARVNGGGAALEDWTTDAGFYSGSSAVELATARITTDASVPPTVPAELFESERHSQGGELTWTIALSAGSPYELRLYFADLVFDTPGQRVFDVYVDGALVLDDYDIAADVGGDVGTMKSFAVTPTNDSLVVRLVPVVEDACLSALEVLNGVPQMTGSVELYGLGLGGANQGKLDVVSIPTVGQPTTFLLSAMGGVDQAFVALGAAKASLPMLGGTLLITLPPVADLLTVPITFGVGTVDFPVPNVPSHVGLEFASQAAAFDPGKPQGWRLTNGAKITIGN